jgi:hypothetical protein
VLRNIPLVLLEDVVVDGEERHIEVVGEERHIEVVGDAVVDGEYGLSRRLCHYKPETMKMLLLHCCSTHT